MAIREVRTDGDEVLRKVSRPVTEMTPRIEQLIGDMIDTMYQYDGVGLAAPQVGVLRRVIVIDVGEGPMVFINPEIVEQSGEQCGQEGCLSIPGVYMDVKRPNHVVVTAKNEKMEDIGARRLHTVIERVIEDISFEASEKSGEKINVTKELVKERLKDVVEDQDLARDIL